MCDRKVVYENKDSVGRSYYSIKKRIAKARIPKGTTVVPCGTEANDKCSVKLYELKRENNDLKSRLSSNKCELDLKFCQARVKSLEEDLHNATEKLKKVKSKLQSAPSTIVVENYEEYEKLREELIRCEEQALYITHERDLLINDVTLLKQEVQNLLNIKDELLASKTKSEEIIEEYKRRVNNLTDEIATQESEYNSEAEAVLNEVNKLREQLATDRRMIEKVEVASEETIALREKLELLEEQFKMAKEHNIEYTRNSKELRDEVVRLEKILESKEEELINLRNAVALYEEIDIDNTATLLQEREAQLALLREEHTDLVRLKESIENGDMKDLQRQLIESQELLSQRDIRIRSLEDENDALKARVEDLTGSIEILSQRLDTTKAKHKQLKANYSERGNEIRELQSDKEKLESIRTNFARRLDELEERHGSDVDRVETLVRERDEFREIGNEATSRASLLDDKLSELQDRYKESQSTLKGALERVDYLQDSIRAEEGALRGISREREEYKQLYEEALRAQEALASDESTRGFIKFAQKHRGLLHRIDLKISESEDNNIGQYVGDYDEDMKELDGLNNICEVISENTAKLESSLDQNIEDAEERMQVDLMLKSQQGVCDEIDSVARSLKSRLEKFAPKKWFGLF